MTGLASRQELVLNALAGGACLTTDALATTIGFSRRAVTAACAGLVSRGLITRRETGLFQISNAGVNALESGEPLTSGPNGPLTQHVPRLNRKEPKRDVIWRAIRIANKFTIAEIETLAEASYDNTRRYVLALEKAGFLVKLRPERGVAPTSNGFSRWALVNDPGPLAPVWRPRRGEVFDRNSGRTIEVTS